MTVGSSADPGSAAGGRSGRGLRIVVVTNIPAPYRIPVYELVDATSGIAMAAVYLAEREPNRFWQLPPTDVPSFTLPGRAVRIGTRWVHVNSGLFRMLFRLRPDVVITTGYNPAQLVSVLWCVAFRVPHIVQTDGTVRSERTLGRPHRMVRHIVRRLSSAFLGASDGSIDLLRSFGAPEHLLFRSPLAIDNATFAPDGRPRPYDLLFSGQLTEIKDPLFAVRVAEAVSSKLQRPVRMAIAGTGPLDADVRDAVRGAVGVDIDLLGFLQQPELRSAYRASRLFLFPTHWDPWGLVANEASAAGVPVLVSEEAGCAGELVVDGVTGFVLPLDVDRWAEAAADLLRNEPARAALGAAAQRRVQAFSFAAAAAGIVEAARAAQSRMGVSRPR